ncbi:hypothetical protein [Aureivirga sp. CE67]|uniref:hypothetical protein n=1 Tax=Aureivirga sp. CE67 TaxID=1788983 RepID=UPI0018CB6679|nr:hypothetical protein [Aureivirga sp. CE67]
MKKFILILSLCFSLFACNKNTDYIIEKGQVGNFTSKNTAGEIKTIFAKDSISEVNSNQVSGSDTNFLNKDEDEYLIYSPEGNELLTIVPQEANDSLSKIKYVEINSPLFKTKKGLSLNSSFKDIKANYQINKIESTIFNVTLFIDELNATIALDKNDLGLKASDAKGEVVADQIPDHAKIKFFTIWFN